MSEDAPSYEGESPYLQEALQLVSRNNVRRVAELLEQLSTATARLDAAGATTIGVSDLCRSLHVALRKFASSSAADRAWSAIRAMPDAEWKSVVEAALHAVRLRSIEAAREPAYPNLDGDDGVSMIAAERVRQVREEGWTPEHDDEHDCGELREAAIAFALSASDGTRDSQERWGRWPWDTSSFHPTDDPIRNLVKAGALLAAEIDRLIRAKAKENA